MQHGAEVIYELDDDNLPVDDLHGFHLTSPIAALSVCTANLTYNPYVHFGQSTVWPRGYPLEHIGEPTSRNYVLRQSVPAPAIQQGLVNADPDVDALFRLTRKHSSVKMDINFDSHAPPLVVPYGTFSPLNSQNTLYRYKAFWALVLPVSTTFRTCDIYRGYWAQRLLWLVGGQVGFYPPNILHQRNAHNAIADAKQETDLLRMGELLESLSAWQCSRMHFFSCVSDLARHMVAGGFWQQLDVDVVEAWLQDLSALGYIPPSLRDVEPTPCTPVGDRQHDVTFYPIEQFTSLPHSGYNFLPHQVRTDRQLEQVIRSTCGGQPAPAKVLATNIVSRDTLLVVNYRSGPEALSLLEAWYRPHFANILYCMTAQHQKLIPKDLLHRWRVSAVVVGGGSGGGSAACLSAASRMGYNVSGYLYTPDVALLHPVKLRVHSATQMWMTQLVAVDDPSLQAMCRAGNVRCVTLTRDVLSTLSTHLPRLDMGSKFKTKLKQCFNKMGGDPRLQQAASSFYLADVVHYLPSRLTNLFTQITDVYLSEPAVKEYDIIAMLMLECIELTPEYLTYGALDGRADPDYTFPFFMSKMVQKQEQHLKFYCEELSP